MVTQIILMHSCTGCADAHGERGEHERKWWYSLQSHAFGCVNWSVISITGWYMCGQGWGEDMCDCTQSLGGICVGRDGGRTCVTALSHLCVTVSRLSGGRSKKEHWLSR